MLIPAEIKANTIEGTATISIAQLDFFRQQAEEVEKNWKRRYMIGK